MEDLKNQIINKSGFLIYTDYWEKYFSKMTGEQIKEVFKIIFHFNLTFEILKTNDLAIEMVVATIIDNIKRDATKRAKQAIASAKNGRLGGRPSKVKAKQKQSKSKTEANVNVNEEINSIYKELADSLLFVLQSKLQKNISNNKWHEDFKLLVEKDLSVRTNPVEDVKKAIQTIADNYGKDYFPVVQSGSSLREKFTKIENYVKRSNQTTQRFMTKQEINRQRDQEIYAEFLKGGDND